MVVNFDFPQEMEVSIAAKSSFVQAKVGICSGRRCFEREWGQERATLVQDGVTLLCASTKSSGVCGVWHSITQDSTVWSSTSFRSLLRNARLVLRGACSCQDNSPVLSFVTWYITSTLNIGSYGIPTLFSPSPNPFGPRLAGGLLPVSRTYTALAGAGGPGTRAPRSASSRPRTQSAPGSSSGSSSKPGRR